MLTQGTYICYYRSAVLQNEGSISIEHAYRLPGCKLSPTLLCILLWLPLPPTTTTGTGNDEASSGARDDDDDAAPR